MRNTLLDSVSNALAIIRMFEESHVLTVTQVAGDLHVAKSTAHRLLSTLVEEDFAQRDPYQRHYLPGPALIAAGLGAMGALDITRRATVISQQLAESIQESVKLVVLQGAYARCVVSARPQRSPVAATGASKGRLLPLHATASGKILLMGKTESDILSRFPSGLPPVTQHTITDMDTLMVDLERSKIRNWAVSNQESTLGVSGLSVPVIGETTRVAAIAVAVPSESFSHARRDFLLEKLFHAAHQIRTPT